MFRPYQHIERITSVSCDGLLENAKIIVQAKLDGTSSSVWFENGDVHCGSRKREITPEEDNAGFANWIQNCDDTESTMIRAFVTANPNLRLFGEWLGSTKFIGHIKDYNIESKSHFYIFDVFDDDSEKYLSFDEYLPILGAYNLDKWVIPILAVLDNPTLDQVSEIAKNNTFLLDNANHPGEGVVIKCYEWHNQFGHQQFGKLILDEYIQKKKKNNIVRIPGNVEQEIIDTYVTDSELSKIYAKIALACSVDTLDIKNGKHVGMFVSTVYHDLLEECPNWVKKMKNPVVDFAALKALCQTKAREYIGL